MRFFDVLYYIKPFSGKKQVRENKIFLDFCGQQRPTSAADTALLGRASQTRHKNGGRADGG
jgi:hypothetical protein